MGKRIAILQSNYIPWQGYFDIINMVDEFILYDDVQFTKNDWRNRNKIKTSSGIQWITIPVRHLSLGQTINETRTAQDNWAEKHYKTFCSNYGRASHFKSLQPALENLFQSISTPYLSEINGIFIRFINNQLGIRTRISRSTDYRLIEGQSERLVDLILQAGGSTYLSGPSARGYLDQAVFHEAGINLEWMDYSGYREYPQLFPPFEHRVTVMDLLLNTGPDAFAYLKSYQE
jgi:hypothetical protein